jgi:hypothetical protein
MDKFRFKLKEVKVGDTETNNGRKSTVTDVDPETGAITWSLEDVADFENAHNALVKAKKYLDSLITSPEAKGDFQLRTIAKEVRDTYNQYRVHLRKNYPEEFKKVSSVNEESTIASNSGFTSGGEGENHNGPSPRKSTYGAYTQAGFKKVTEGPGATLGFGPKAGPEGVTKNKYVTDFKYKLVGKAGAQRAAHGLPAKQLKEADTNVEEYLNDLNISNPDNKKWIASRLLGFDTLETKLNELLPLLQQAKHETMDYYRQNPESFTVVYGTDLANDYLNDLIELFKK